MNKIELFNILEMNFNIKEIDIKNFYIVGSKISNTINNESDTDYCIVLNKEEDEFTKVFFKDKARYDISFYGIKTYQAYLDIHNLYFVEHTYYPDDFF